MGRAALTLGLVAVAVVTVLIEWLAFAPAGNVGVAAADGAVGGVLLGSAVIAWDRRRESRVGPLMAVAGIAWLAGTLWPSVLLLHRGPLVHLHLSYPTGRLTWRPALVTVVAVYAVSLLEPAVGHDGLTLAVAVAVTAVAAGAFMRQTGTARRAGIPALVAAVAFSAALSLGAGTRLAGWRVDTLGVYSAVVLGAIVILLVDLLRGRWADAVVTGLVVDLGHRGDTGTLRNELARALGDPTLTVGYWLAGEERYVDETGRPIDPHEVSDGRVVTPIDHEGGPLAVLVHDAAVLDDPALVESATAAARLAVANAQMQADTRDRVVAIAASRRRLIEAADVQRRRLSLELRAEVHDRLDRVAQLVAHASDHATGGGGALYEIVAELGDARADLDELAQGLYPVALTEGGIPAALPGLAARCPVPVSVDITVGRLPSAIEAAIYFLCAEALTNVAKYAGANRVSLAIRSTDGTVTAVVRDDGDGGADPQQGSGLRGLADRIAALGGDLQIASNPGAGTKLAVSIPR